MNRTSRNHTTMNHTTMNRTTMNRTSRNHPSTDHPGPARLLALSVGVALMLVGTGVAPAAAGQGDGSPVTGHNASCPLMRIGTQFVRCDNLTGAGSRAPSWVPEA